MGEAAVPLRKPSQRHSTLRGIDAHHVLCALNPNASHLRATAASLAECTQLQQHHSELAADRARDRQNRVRERLRSASRRQSAGGDGREREGRARRRQSTGDVGRERKRESAAATHTQIHTRNCHGTHTQLPRVHPKVSNASGCDKSFLKKKNPNRQRHSHTLDAECSDPALYV